MKPVKFARLALLLAVVVAVALGAAWLAWRQRDRPIAPATISAETGPPYGKIIVNERAQKNLALSAVPLNAQTHWKTLQIPGMVVDLPGRSDRNVTSPITGVVARVNCFPGDTVRPGEVLFALKLLSESLHQTQSDLFKATQDAKLARVQRQRLIDARAVVPETRIIEAENQVARLEVAARAYRLELLSRGFAPEQIDAVADGKFVTEIPIVVPPRPADARPLTSALLGRPALAAAAAPTFEIQELKVELGQQVQAGQTLCLLANHQQLAVEGRAFRDETPLLERNVREGWPVEVDFQEDAAADWPQLKQAFRIRHMANTIDPVNRTFAFLMPLENQSRVVEQEGRTQMLWRFRPGQRVRVLVRVEKLDNVFVLPADAVAREGTELFVFTQNVNTFERKAVRVLLQDRKNAIVANDGSLLPGSFVVQCAAAQLNRMVKAGSSGVPKGYHIHADGSLHKNDDEGK